MPFAIVQKSLDPVSPEALRKVFQALEELTAADAKGLAKDAFGVLAEKLPFKSAAALQQALRAQGIETDVVDQRELPKLPPAKRLKRADCLPEKLVLYDALGRPKNIPWPQVRLIAAGAVSLIEARRIETERTIRHYKMPIPVVDVHYREQEAVRLVLEIYVQAIPPRYLSFARQFQYTYLGGRRASTAAENFVLLVRDLMRHATSAWANRGAAAMASDPPETFAYPTRHAFEEESIWTLWKARRPDGEKG